MHLVNMRAFKHLAGFGTLWKEMDEGTSRSGSSRLAIRANTVVITKAVVTAAEAAAAITKIQPVTLRHFLIYPAVTQPKCYLQILDTWPWQKYKQPNIQESHDLQRKNLADDKNMGEFIITLWKYCTPQKSVKKKPRKRGTTFWHQQGMTLGPC